jgi:hypothetical protein
MQRALIVIGLVLAAAGLASVVLSRIHARRAFAVVLLATCGAPLAQGRTGRDAPGEVVVITAPTNAVSKSYRKMVAGMDLFERRRSLAPAASLRYKLLPRKPGTVMDDVGLEVVGDSLVIPVKVAQDYTFILERNRVALREDAEVTPDRKAGTMTWRAEVRTPGLPPDTRRLGDLRLECEVGMKAGLTSQYPPGFFRLLDELFPENPGYCRRAVPRYLFFADRPLFSVTLVDGSRREVLSVDMLYGGAARDPDWKKDRYCDCVALFDRAYFVPLGDESWPDDTLVVLEYMEDGSSALSADKRSKADVRAALGEAVVVDFASGYEVWVYRQRRTDKSAAERVLLFPPSGVLAKTRVR